MADPKRSPLRATRSTQDGRRGGNEQAPPAKTLTPRPASRRSTRKQIILAAAIDLFRSDGFHRVGIDDIGAAAGISGPGVYRHFPNKHGVLVAIFDEVISSLLKAAGELVGSAAGPEDALRALIYRHVDFALDDRALISVYMQEERNLPEPERRRLRRAQRDYLAHWVTQLSYANERISAPLALSLVHATIGLIGSVAFYEPTAPRPELREMLAGNAIRLLLAPADGTPPSTR